MLQQLIILSPQPYFYLEFYNFTFLTCLQKFSQLYLSSTRKGYVAGLYESWDLEPWTQTRDPWVQVGAQVV